MKDKETGLSDKEGLIMSKSVAKYYGADRIFDFEDFDGMLGRRCTKRRAHRRLRQQLAKEAKAAIRDMQTA